MSSDGTFLIDIFKKNSLDRTIYKLSVEFYFSTLGLNFLYSVLF